MPRFRPGFKPIRGRRSAPSLPSKVKLAQSDSCRAGNKAASHNLLVKESVTGQGSRKRKVLLRFFKVRLDTQGFFIVGASLIIFAFTTKHVRKLFMVDLKVPVD